MSEAVNVCSDSIAVARDEAPQALSINRHAMQQLLHAALMAGERACMGLLTGREGVVEGILPLSKQAFEAFRSGKEESRLTTGERQSLIGIYQAADVNCEIDPNQTRSLRHYFTGHSKQQPGCYLLLDTSHKGRIEARCFADAGRSLPIPLNMQEEAALYPIPANG